MLNQAYTMKLAEEPLPGVVMETTPCPLGCPAGDEWVLDSYDYHNRLPGKFRVVKCRTCGLMRTDPRPARIPLGYITPLITPPMPLQR